MATQAVIEQYQVPRIKIHCNRSGTDVFKVHIMPGTFRYVAGTATDDGFGPGAVQAQSLTFTVRNVDGSMSGAFQRGDRIVLYDGYGMTDDGTTWEKVAELDVYDVSRKRFDINVTCYDALSTIGDQPDGFYVQFPTTVGGICEACAAGLGMSLQSSTFPGSSIPVDLRDADGNPPGTNGRLGLTIRQALSEACRISGNYARLNADNKLVVGWYPSAASVAPPESWVFDYELGEEPVSYTGVKVGDRDVSGSGTGAVYTLESNAFLTDANAAAVEVALKTALVDHNIYAMDLSIVTDLAHIVPGGVLQGTYHGPVPGTDGEPGDMFAIQTPITSITWEGGMLMAVTCDVPASARGDGRPTGSTRAAQGVLDQALKNPGSDLSKAIAAAGSGGGGSGGTGGKYTDIFLYNLRFNSTSKMTLSGANANGYTGYMNMKTGQYFLSPSVPISACMLSGDGRTGSLYTGAAFEFAINADDRLEFLGGTAPGTLRVNFAASSSIGSPFNAAGMKYSVNGGIYVPVRLVFAGGVDASGTLKAVDSMARSDIKFLRFSVEPVETHTEQTIDSTGFYTSTMLSASACSGTIDIEAADASIEADDPRLGYAHALWTAAIPSGLYVEVPYTSGTPTSRPAGRLREATMQALKKP